MLELLCYLLTVIFASLAVISGSLLPPLDRIRLLSVAFACFVLPFLVDTTQSL